MAADWATTAEFPDYRFYKDGRVYSLVVNRFMSPIKMGAYRGLQLRSASGTRRKEYLHRLICTAFSGPCPQGMECRHLDGDRDNNSAGNLAWGTRQENHRDKICHGTANVGSRNSMAKLTDEQVKQMRNVRRREGASYTKIAAQFGVSRMTAFRAVTGQSWSNLQ